MSDRLYLRTWGEFACFTRPEMKVERVSYPVITPSAARGILEAILYRPQFRWRVHRIAVCKPIRFLSFRRNEVKSRLSSQNAGSFYADDDRTQRNSLLLRDVEYVIEASIVLTSLAGAPRRKPTDNPEDNEPDTVVKYQRMFERRVKAGQCFVQPCFGCREFPAHFELAQARDMLGSETVNSDADLGFMIYDVFDLDQMHEPGPVKKVNPLISVFSARLISGVMEIPPWEEVREQFTIAQDPGAVS